MTGLPDFLEGFTNREPQIAAFDALWEDEIHWTLAFSGVSGIGKSHLIDYLVETRCKPRGIRIQKIDFDGVVALEDIPLAFSRLLSAQARTEFERDARALRQEYEQAVLEIDRSVPHSVTLEQRAEGGGHIGDSPATIDVQYQERRRDLSLLFFTQLARLAVHQAAALDDSPLLLILDTYEKFADNNQDDTIGRVWSFLSQCAQEASALRVLVAGREQLPYRPLARFTRDEPLDDFSAVTSDAFLKNRGVDDAALRHGAFDLARGHPFTTRMFAEAYQEAQRAGRPITLAELTAGARARSRDEWFYDLVLSRLPEPERTAATYAPLLRHFNQGILNRALVIEMEEGVFRRFTKRSFIKRVGEGTYKFHEAARNVQRAYLYASDDSRVKEIHQRAAEFYANPTDVPAARDWLYHSLIAAPQTVFDQWEQALGFAAFTFEHEWWGELLEAIETPSALKDLQTEQRAQVLYERMRWHYYHLEELEEGLRKGQAALRLYREVGSRVGEANTRKAIGDVQQFRNDMDAALTSYEQALGLFREVGDRLGEANTLQAIGDVQRFRDDNDAALTSYEQALGLYRAVGSRVGEANTRKAIGDVQQFRKDMDAALTSYEQALGLFREVGDRLGEANTLQAIGDVQQFRKDMDAALTSYEQALGLYRAVGSRLGEANTLAAQGQLFLIDNPQRADELLGQAVTLFQQIGDRYSIPAQIGNYGWALLRLNQAERAQPYLSRAADLFDEMGLSDYAAQHRQYADAIEAATSLARANDLYQKKNYDAAVAEFQAGLERMPSTEAWNGLGNALESLERFDEAIEAYSRAIELDSDAAYLYRNRANVLLNLNWLAEAEKDIARAVELEPDSAYTHARQGELALRRGEFAEAVSHYEFSVAHDENVDWKFGLALAKFGAGDLAGAKAVSVAANAQVDEDEKKEIREWFERVAKARPELADATRELL